MSESVLASKTRSKTICNGNLCVMTDEIRQCCRGEMTCISNFICKYHFQIVTRRNRRRRSCPAPWPHSQTIGERPIPSRLYSVFDEVGATDKQYNPGTRWCHRCKSRADAEFFPSLPKYIPPSQSKHCDIRDRSPLVRIKFTQDNIHIKTKCRCTTQR